MAKKPRYTGVPRYRGARYRGVLLYLQSYIVKCLTVLGPPRARSPRARSPLVRGF